MFPDGRLLLTTPDFQSDIEVRQIMRAFDRWAKGPIGSPLVIPGTEVRVATSIEVDLAGEREGVE